MPKTIMPKMSNDQLCNFDGAIDSVSYDPDGFLLVETSYVDEITNKSYTIILDQKDLEDMLTFLKSNKETK